MRLASVPFFLMLAAAELAVAPAGALAATQDDREAFVQVADGHLVAGGKPYRYVGTNFWYGMNLASPGAGGDVQRLRRELDRLQALGVTNLRVVAGSEGPNAAPYRMVPALRPGPGLYDEQVFAGLDVLLAEMHARGMRAVVCLGDFWQWSGGFAQEVSWAEGGSAIPYPDHGDWDTFQKYAARFYVLPAALNSYWQHVDTVVQRVNSVTHIAYRDDPTIMAWQLANEPRGMDHPREFVAWVRSTSQRIKALDHRHLVTTGSEGMTPSTYSQTLPEVIHALPDIDYLTFHIWIQNWNWYDPQIPSTYATALNLAKDYLHAHAALASKLGKPAVLEEFGLSRDSGSFLPAAPTAVKDAYYAAIFDEVYQLASQRPGQGQTLDGVNFWAWAGEARPVHPGGVWQVGDAWIGDPPHEPQGWYSVYDTDASTISVIKAYAQRMHDLQDVKAP